MSLVIEACPPFCEACQTTMIYEPGEKASRLLWVYPPYWQCPKCKTTLDDSDDYWEGSEA